MPDLTANQPELIANAAKEILERARRQLDDLEKRAEIVCATTRSYFEEAHLVTRAKRLFVADFRVDHPLTVHPGAGVDLAFPGSVWIGDRGSMRLELERYESDEEFLPTGRYRAVVALVPLDEPAEKP